MKEKDLGERMTSKLYGKQIKRGRFDHVESLRLFPSGPHHILIMICFGHKKAFLTISEQSSFLNRLYTLADAQ